MKNEQLNSIDLGSLVSDVSDNNDGHVIAVHNSGDGTTTNIEESVTTLTYDDANTRLQYLDENGATNNIDLNGLVSDANDLNDGHLIAEHVDGNGNVTNIEETVTSIGFNTSTNQIEYVDEAGNTNPVDLGPLVSDLTDSNNGNVIATHVSGNGVTTNIEESVTTLTYDDSNTRLEYTDENGFTNNIDLNGLVSDANDLNDGHLIAEHVDGNGNVTSIEETVTSIGFNTSTNQIEYVDEAGTTIPVNLGPLVSDLTDSNDGHTIATHVSGDGTSTNIEETVTTITYDDANTRIQYIDENGFTNNVDLNGLLSSANDLNNGNIIAEHVDGNGNVTNIEETVTSLQFNNVSNRLEYTDENGSVNEVGLGDLVSNVTDSNDGNIIATHVAGDGTSTNIEESVTTLTYDDANTRIQYTDESGTINNVDLTGLLSSANDLNDGHLIAEHVDGDGNVTSIEETVTTLSYDDANTRIQYTDENGNTNNVSLSGLLSSANDLNDGHLIAEHVDGDGNVTSIEETVTSIGFNTSTNQIEYIDETGTTIPVNLGPLVSNVTDSNDGHIIATHVAGDGTSTNIEETVTTLTYDDANTRIQYSDENGNTNNVDLSGLLSSANDLNDGHLIAEHVDANGNVTDIEETVTSLTYDDANTRMQYTDENGITNNIDLSGIMSTASDLNNGHLIAEHTDANGVVTRIEETVTSIGFNTSTNQIEYIDEEGTTIPVNLGPLVSNVTDSNDGHVIATHVSGNGTSTNIEETVTTLTYDDANTRIQYSDENGNTNNVDLSGLLSSANDLNNGHLIAEHVDGDGNVTSIEETVTALTYDDSNTRLQYADENGNTNNVDLSGLLSSANDLNDGNLIAEHVDGDGNVTNIEETVTTVTSSGFKAWTFTSEDGTETEFDARDCFYPPSVPVDASTTGTFSLDLYGNYAGQFGSPAISSPGASAPPVVPASNLDFHVLDYDNNVMNVTNLTAGGVMTYEITAVPKDNCTYINVLFCENDNN